MHFNYHSLTKACGVCLENHLASTFIVYHPLLDLQAKFHPRTEPSIHSDTSSVLVCLLAEGNPAGCGLAQLWYTHQFRASVYKHTHSTQVTQFWDLASEKNTS